MGINYKAIGTKIKEYRMIKNYTQEELAEKTNLSVIHISNIERGISYFSLATLKKLSSVLNFDISVDIQNQTREYFKKKEISAIFQNCCEKEYEILYDVLIATKNSLDLNLNFKY